MNDWTILGWAALLLVAVGLIWRERIRVKNGRRMHNDYDDCLIDKAELRRHHLNMEEEAIRSSDTLERIADSLYALAHPEPIVVGSPMTLGDELAVEGRDDDRETDFDLSAGPDSIQPEGDE